MAPDVGIFLIWTGACVFLQADHVNGAHMLPGILQYSSFSSDNRCVFPFSYGGQKHFDCTNQNSLYMWCSLTEKYTGKWKYCTKDDYAPCSFPFIYGGKTYDKCTNEESFFGKFWCAVTPNYDTDKAWKHCY